MPSDSTALRHVAEHENFFITLSDGCSLAARGWMPEDAEREPVPAILEYLPYRKRDGTCARDALTHPYFAARGYACVRVDTRGNGDSDGLMADEYTETELRDGVEVIEWLARQPWCSGRVGIMGISWGGFNGLQIAALAPSALGAVVTLCSTDDRYADDIHYKGGLLLNENLGWSGTMLSYSSRPPDPALVGERWRELWLARLEAEPFLAHTWAQHPTRDAYWQHGSVGEDFCAIKAAVLAVGGWGDAYKNAVPRLLAGLEAPAKGIVGPWVHKYPHFAVPEPRIGFLQEALRWWDRWLKDIDTGIEAEPDYRAYVIDSAPPKPWYLERAGRWVGVAKSHVAVSGEGSMQHWTLRGDGRLSNDTGALDTGAFSTAIASPYDCGMDAGEYCAIWLGPELPGDQRRDDALSACFDSNELDAPLALLGAAVVELTLASDQPVAQLAVRLNDVAPDGASTRISYGVLNLCHRASHATPEALVPGESVTVRVQLDDAGYRLAAGHRLRVSVSSAYWPLVWPSPAPVRLTLTGGRLALPVIDIDALPEPRFAAPESAPPWQVDVLREPSNRRDVHRDMASGIVTLEIVEHFGAERDRSHGLTTGSVARERWSIHPSDPLSARGETHWTQTLERGDWHVRTEARSSMWSDAEYFHLEAHVEAFEGSGESPQPARGGPQAPEGSPVALVCRALRRDFHESEERVFEKRWAEKVRRRFS